MSNRMVYRFINTVSASFLALAMAFFILWLPAAEAAKNVKPTVNAGADQVVGLSQIVYLNAVANDPDGAIVRTVWKQIEIEDIRVNLVNSNSSSSYFTTPAKIKGSKQVTLFFRVTVTDNNNATASDIIKITIPKGIQPLVTLTVNKTGVEPSIATTVSSDYPPVNDCFSDTCTYDVPAGTVITFNGIDSGITIFKGWTSPATCTGITPCTVVMNSPRTVTANFGYKQFTATVIKIGSGTVTSNIGNIQCGSVCTSTPVGDQMILTAMPAPGFTVSPVGNWNCVGMFPVCTMTIFMTSDQSIGVTFSPIGQPPKPQTLNDTGIAGCSNNATLDLPCPQTGYPGQDGDSGRDVANNDDTDGHAGFSFTKIDSNGNTLPPTDTAPWQCVKDNVTGLMWEVKTDDSGLHDKDWTYTWYNGSTINDGTNGTANGGSCGLTSLCDTFAYVQVVNAAGWCGKNDWRMPKAEELRSIVSYDRGLPAIESTYFPNTISDGYLVAEKTLVSGARTGGGAAISFQYGNLYDSFFAPKAYVRLVRSD